MRQPGQLPKAKPGGLNASASPERFVIEERLLEKEYSYTFVVAAPDQQAAEAYALEYTRNFYHDSEPDNSFGEDWFTDGETWWGLQYVSPVTVQQVIGSAFSPSRFTVI